LQPLNSYFETAIRRGYALTGKALVVAEWNYNNLFNAKVTNPPDDQNWIMNKDYFPVTSIIKGVRPNSTGIFYAFTDESFTDMPNGLAESRYYLMDDKAYYQYWICPTRSEWSASEGESDGFPDVLDYAVSRGTVEIDYENFLNMNKLSVTFNLGPIPIDWSLKYFEETANEWIFIDSPTINPITGKCEVWFDGENWVEEQQLSENIYQSISKVGIEVRTIDQADMRFQVVELAGKREIDMTSRVESYDMNMSMDNDDLIHPIGQMSSNDGSIEFNNNDLKMNHEDPTSDFYGALEGWCQYRLYVNYDLSDYNGPEEHIVRVGTMFANDWIQENEHTYQVELFDIFKILQSIECPPILLENQPIAMIVATLLDSVGIDSYYFEYEDFDTSNTVKYFWADGTEKLFDVLDSLCASHQAAMFVDEFGKIRLLTRNDITVREDEEPVWTFRGEKVGLDLPDIVKLDKKYDLIANKAIIKYTKREAKIDDIDIRDQPLTSTVWDSSDTTVLRAAPLRRTLNESGEYNATDPGEMVSNFIWIPSEVAPTWPYKGKVNIDGELIVYEGNGYVRYDDTKGVYE